MNIKQAIKDYKQIKRHIERLNIEIKYYKKSIEDIENDIPSGVKILSDMPKGSISRHNNVVEKVVFQDRLQKLRRLEQKREQFQYVVDVVDNEINRLDIIQIERMKYYTENIQLETLASKFCISKESLLNSLNRILDYVEENFINFNKELE